MVIGTMCALCCFFPPWQKFRLALMNSICEVDAVAAHTEPSLCYCGLFLGKND